MICGAFHTKNDHWILPHKLRVLSEVCDKVVCVCDRDPVAEDICKRFPKVEAVPYTPTHDIPQRDDGGSIQCEEGWMRQVAWDRCQALGADWILLGDSDEVPTPDVLGWLKENQHEQPKVEVYYWHLENLYGGILHYITGPCIYSSSRKDSNKRGAFCRVRPGVKYKYRQAFKHVRLEPNPVHEVRPIIDGRHVLLDQPRMIHYKWAHWPRWEASPQRHSTKYQQYLLNLELSQTPAPWLWRWSADEYLKTLTGTVAVVGNAPMTGKGAEIDAHDNVFRFNNWKTGHEQDVGGKCTCWVSNAWVDIEHRDWPGEILTTTPDGEHDESLGPWMGMYPHTRQPDDDWRGLAAQFFKIRRPSTGLRFLLACVRYGLSVDCYGFDGFQSGHYWNPSQTWPKGHDSQDEARALFRISSMGVNFR